MPTANLHLLEGELPPSGVYATRVRIGNRIMNSVTNIGTRPSVDDEGKITIEVNIFDFNGNIYGEVVTLEILKFLRPVQKFDNLQAVHRQVEKDILAAKAFFEVKKTQTK